MDSFRSRYELLLACFQQYAKIKALLEIIPSGDYNIEANKLESLLNLLNDNNLRFYYLQSYIFEIQEKIKNVIDAREMESLFKKQVEVEKEITDLNKIPVGYPFTLEQSLNLFDFFGECFEKLNN
jgi:hypothetical protein